MASAPIQMPPPRPRLKRSHPTEPTAEDVASSSNGTGPIAVPVAASPTALPTGAIAWALNGNGAGYGARTGALEPISEATPAAEQGLGGNAFSASDSGLGLDLHGRGSNMGMNGNSGDGDAGVEEQRRATKRIRVAPDHEAFGRLSLDRTPSSIASPASQPLGAIYAHGPAGSPRSAVPPHLLRQPSQPLPTPPLASSAFASSFSSPIDGSQLGSPSSRGRREATPPSVAVPPPTHAFSSPTLASASLPSAPPTSPVQATAPRMNGSTPLAFSPPPVAPSYGTPGALPTVPWSQSAFFSPSAQAPPTHSISPPSGSSDHALANAARSNRTDEIEMGSANASSWDLDPHRIYVASLDADDEADASDTPSHGDRASESLMDDSAEQQLRLNALAARRAATASALPASLIASLEREAAKAREGSLVLYRPPPWAASAVSKGGSNSAHEKALDKHEESWREFERERQRVEHADADGDGMSDAGETAFDDDTLIGADEGGMDVDMEL